MLVDQNRMVWHPDDISSILEKMFEGAGNA